MNLEKRKWENIKKIGKMKFQKFEIGNMENSENVKKD